MKSLSPKTLPNRMVFGNQPHGGCGAGVTKAGEASRDTIAEAREQCNLGELLGNRADRGCVTTTQQAIIGWTRALGDWPTGEEPERAAMEIVGFQDDNDDEAELDR